MINNKSSTVENAKHVQRIITEVMGSEFWNEFADAITTEKPRIDMYDDDDIITVSSEIPGILDTEDLSISVSSNKLTIRGVIRDKYLEDKPGKKIKSERFYGPFDRTIELPYAVDEDSIEASYENGILQIKMEKADTEDEKPIKVEFKK